MPPIRDPRGRAPLWAAEVPVQSAAAARAAVAVPCRDGVRGGAGAGAGGQGHRLSSGAQDVDRGAYDISPSQVDAGQ